MNKSASLPEIKGLKKLKRREQKKINRSVVRRLYSHEIKKIKLKNNSFMYKKPEDVSLEKQVKKLRKRKLIPLQSNICFLPTQADRPEIKNLYKLQDNMRQAIYIPKIDEKSLVVSENVFYRNQSLEHADLYAPYDLIEDDEEFTLSIAQQKEQLTFVKTRIKVIMTTLPKLRENLETWSKNSTHFTTISKKIEKLVTLLKTYETTKEKLKSSIKACEKTLQTHQKLQNNPNLI